MEKKPTVLALNCTLKNSKQSPTASTERLLSECLKSFHHEGVEGEIVRVADFDIKPGVSSDEGEGDEWPALRKKILACDILLIGTPIWVGQASSIAKRVFERMDAFLEEKDKLGRMPSYGKLGLVAVVGNEDGAHYIAATMFQAFNDLGFTVPANAMTYWCGEAMSDHEYKDLKKTPKEVQEATEMMVKNAVHLAGLLKKEPYPSLK